MRTGLQNKVFEMAQAYAASGSFDPEAFREQVVQAHPGYRRAFWNKRFCGELEEYLKQQEANSQVIAETRYTDEYRKFVEAQMETALRSENL